MESELVARLRVSTVADSADSIYQTMTDAADEIERLQAHLNYWKNTACSMLQNLIHEQAVRDE